MSRRDLFDIPDLLGNNDYDATDDIDEFSEEQEEIKELKNSNNKLSGTIKDLKKQLFAAEESNANLQSEFDRVYCKLKIEQSLSNELNKKLEEFDDLKEIEINLQQKISKLQYKLKENEKENTQLLKIINENEKEKNQREESFEKTRAQLNDLLKLQQAYQEDIVNLHSKLTENECIIKELSVPKLELEQTIMDQKSKIEYLMFENELLIKNQKTKLYCSPLTAHLTASHPIESDSYVIENPFQLPNNQHENNDVPQSPNLTINSSEEEYVLLTEYNYVPFHKSLKSELKEIADNKSSEDDIANKNKIKYLENQVEHLERELSTKNVQIESLQTNINDIENSLDIEKCKSEKLISQLNNITIEKARLETNVSEMKIEIRKISNTYTDLSDRYIEEIETFKEKIELLKESNQQYVRYQEKFQLLKSFLFDKSQKLNSASDMVLYKLRSSKKYNTTDLSLLSLSENSNIFPDEDLNFCSMQISKCLFLFQILNKLDELLQVEYKDSALQVDLKSTKSDTATQTKEIKKKLSLEPARLIYSSNKSKTILSKFSAGRVQYNRMFDLEMETLTETVPVQINSKSINNSTSSNTELNNNVEDNNASDHSSKTSVGWTEDGEITEYKYLEELSSLKKMQRDSQNEISAAHFTVKANVEPEPADSLDSLPLLMLDGNRKESTISDEFLKAEIAVNGNQIERKLSSVSADSRNSDVEESSSTFSKARISTPKLEDMPIRQESNRSISVSSTNSGSSESLSVDNEFCTLRDEIKHNIRTSLESTVEATRRSLQDQKDNELLPSVDEKKLNDRSRSHSISDASTDSKNEEIDTFPSLSDTTLEELGLLRSDVFESDSPGLDEIERKYQVLTLAFATDTMTLQMRHERLRRLRDQAEDNLATEIARLDNGIRRLKPLCIDAERTELVSSLLTQIDVLIQASSRVSTSSETYGAVQQEWRLSDAMNLIINFVESLKQQRDTAKRQLQCTKRMLQDSTTVEGVKATNIRQKASSASHNNNTSNRLIARRRASIAAISRPLGSTEPPKPFTRNQLPTSLNLESLSRRSKLPERLSPSRASLSPRSDHNGEILQHISEYTENAEGSPEHESRRESCESHSTEVLLIGNTLMRRVSLRICNLFRRFVGDEFLGQGTFNEICCTGALLCFAIAIMILANTMLEYFMMRNNRIVQRIPWNWCSWEEIFRPFVQKNYNNGPPPI